MGQDIIIMAENINGVDIDDFRKVLKQGGYPAGSGKFVEETEFAEDTTFPTFELTEPNFAYHYVQFIHGFVAVHDGCRYTGEGTSYKKQLAKVVEDLTGGLIEIISDAMQAEDYVYSQQIEVNATEGLKILESIFTALKTSPKSKGKTEQLQPLLDFYTSINEGYAGELTEQ